jgi:PAS domain S-box-containing protein
MRDVTIPVVLFDRTGAIRYSNRAHDELLLQHGREVVGRKIWALAADRAEQARIREQIGRLSADATTGLRLAVKLRRGDGAVLDVRWDFGCIADIDQPSACYCCFATDLTRQSVAESSLRESENRFRALVESSPIGFWEITVDGYTKYLNPAMAAMLEIRGIEDLEGKTAYAFFTPASLEVMRREHARRIKGISGQYEAELVSARGTHHHIAIYGSPMFEPDGRVGGMIATMMDITHHRDAREILRQAHDDLDTRVKQRTAELHAANEALRESERLYRLLAENSSDMISRHAPDGVYLYASPACRTLLGFEPEELVGRSAYDLFHPEDLARLRAVHDAVLERPESETIEYRIRRKDGRYIWIESNARSIRDPKTGEVLEIHAASRDATARKAAEDEARRRQAEFAHFGRLSVMGEMAAGIAHELNQPLAAIANFARGCVMRIYSGAEPVQLVPAMEAAAGQAERASYVIQHIIRLARKHEPRRSTVRIQDLVDDVSSFMEFELRETSVSLERDLPADLPPVICDRVQIEQVLLNLVRNAIDSMGHLADQPRAVTIRARRNEQELEVAVIDSGRGISDEDTKKIFDAFYTTKRDGLGMGLPICQSILDAHHGRLWATRNPTAGATFHFVLPISPAS